MDYEFVAIIAMSATSSDPREVAITPLGLAGRLRLPPGARCLVVFAHGSGSSRLSPRNNAVAEALGAHAIGTLLFDLLTPAEEADRRNVFDIPLLAGESLELVAAPTLLIVGGADYGVIELNEEALKRLKGPKSLEIVPGATHLFEEPGALEMVVEHAARWFERYLGGARQP